MSTEEIITTKAVAKLLNEKKAQLSKRISAIEADFHKGRSQDFSEQATETENDDVLDEIHHEAKAELKLINDTLSRIEQGLYGQCSQCEEAINPDRLNAIPYTTTCIHCAV
ncbi:TraR/DksA family transcriptional regulator [Colwellia sp. D2M02]|uniref:DksA C4-type domain-containing protein n=1 Tax=Colwellia asteriadis TaxID=517723 RepID=A0ABN1L7L3_9GAMM|nr:TraR/DksA family transcriptional regulator [Colwellia sp. D2M02]MBU2894720.1 TraR/DksA family transcriptional regulator [Colwellia sp. D2M02]